ncbi:hypothetical protein MANES_15G079000v8 [Manihot esculenta]|uniref:Uncharacterized protein n=1 Tax=Manihot esculenta TaxID=3983 RepID=A0ACB7GB82_MANES|nr:hypothetical protein MANES_15G079000v8 [Manihot esculenta]
MAMMPSSDPELRLPLLQPSLKHSEPEKLSIDDMLQSNREPDFRCLGSGCDPRAKSVCRFEPGSWEWVGGLESSTVAQWGLVSAQKFKVGLVQAVFFGGCTIGSGTFISESPRWYLVRRRISEAMKLMNTIAKSNGNHLPDGFILALDEEANNSDDRSCKEEPATKEAITGSLVDVIRSPLTRMRLFLAVAINFLCSVVYYGISLNVVNLETNPYLNVLLNAVAEMPAFTITALLLNYGLFCLMGNAGIWKIIKMICGILGIFGMAGTYNLLFIYTAKLFPTVVRNAALGSGTQAAQMGAILAPIVVHAELWEDCLPETLNRPFYDTMTGIEDGEAFEGFAS